MVCGGPECSECGGVLRWAQWLWVFIVFVDSSLFAFVSFLFSLSFFFGRDCGASAPAPIVGCIGVGCFVIQSGGKPFFIKRDDAYSFYMSNHKSISVRQLVQKKEGFFCPARPVVRSSMLTVPSPRHPPPSRLPPSLPSPALKRLNILKQTVCTFIVASSSNAFIFKVNIF